MANIIKSLLWVVCLFGLVGVVFGGDLVILCPEDFVVPSGEEVNIPFIVMNSSLVDLVNGSVDCSFVLVNNVGGVVSDGVLVYNVSVGVWDYGLDENETGEVGDYVYYIHCNNSEFGYVSGVFSVTPSGYEGNLQEALVYCLLIGILVVFFVVVLAVGFSVDGRNEFDFGGKLVKINYGKYLKIVCFFLGYLLLWVLDTFIWQASQRFLILSGFADVLEVSFIILTVLLIPVFLCFGGLMIVKVVLDAKLHKLAKRGLKPRK